MSTNVLSMEPWAAAKKIFKLAWQCHQVMSRFLTKGHLARVSCQSANCKGVNEMIPGPMHGSPGICLTAEEIPKKPQQGDSLMKGLCDQLSPQMRSVGSHSTSGREKEGNKEGTGN